MFKPTNFADELAESMQSNLVGGLIKKEASITKTAKINKFSDALTQLSKAAELFDELGLTKQAEATTILLEVLAGKKKKSKPKKKSKTKTKSSPKKTKKITIDPAMKDLDSDKMLDNLKHKGWVFNADDGDNSLDIELGFETEDDKNMPDDSETCGDCGYDHMYSPTESNSWHKAHPGSYKGIPGHEDNKKDEDELGDFGTVGIDENFAEDLKEAWNSIDKEDDEDFEDDEEDSFFKHNK
jgi:DNA-directed RNA polymerase subunit M/transcription elongation factor TFIIS